jgi:hypothetical protein
MVTVSATGSPSLAVASRFRRQGGASGRRRGSCFPFRSQGTEEWLGRRLRATGGGAARFRRQGDASGRRRDGRILFSLLGRRFGQRHWPATGGSTNVYLGAETGVDVPTRRADEMSVRAAIVQHIRGRAVTARPPRKIGHRQCPNPTELAGLTGLAQPRERGLYNALAMGESITGRRSIASQVQMWVRCSGLVRQHMCSPEAVHGISSIHR